MNTRILVPLDGSPLSEQVLPEVRKFVAGLGTSVVELLYVLDPAAMADTKLMSARALKRSQHLAEAYLEEQARTFAPDVEVHHVVSAGPPALVILNHARTGGFDYIFMATHGRSGLARAVTGSVTDRVIREATIPVVAIHPLPVTDRKHSWPGDDAPTAELIALFTRGDALSARAVDVLASRGPEAVPGLLKAVGNPSAEVRQFAAKTLGAIRDARALPALVEHLSDEVWEVRWQAGEALAQQGEAGIRAVLELVMHAPADARRDLGVVHVLERAPMVYWAPLKPVLRALHGQESAMAAPIAAARALRTMTHPVGAAGEHKVEEKVYV